MLKPNLLSVSLTLHYNLFFPSFLSNTRTLTFNKIDLAPSKYSEAKRSSFFNVDLPIIKKITNENTLFVIENNICWDSPE